MMQTHLSNAKMYYDNLVADKEEMKLISLSSRRQAEILGVLFAEYEILTTEQASIIRQQMDKPSFFYNGGKDTLWSFYNHATVALQQSHPRTWMEDQRMLHWFISNEFNLGQVLVAPITPAVEITVPMVDPLNAIPNQTNILDQIAEIESTLMADDDVWPEVEEVSTGIYVPIISEEDLAEDLYGVNNHDVEVNHSIIDDLVHYTDPAGNTFEAIEFHNAVTAEEEVVVDDFITDEEEDAVLDQILVPVAPERVKFSVDNTEEPELDFDLNFEDDEEGDSNQFFL